MSEYLKRTARKISRNLCGVSVYGDDGLLPSAVQAVAEGYLELVASRDFDWAPPRRAGLKWKCAVCKRKYFIYNNAYDCCLNK